MLTVPTFITKWWNLSAIPGNIAGNETMKKLNRHALYDNHMGAITRAGQSILVDNIIQWAQHENSQCTLIVKNINILGIKSFIQLFHIRETVLHRFLESIPTNHVVNHCKGKYQVPITWTRCCTILWVYVIDLFHNWGLQSGWSIPSTSIQGQLAPINLCNKTKMLLTYWCKQQETAPWDHIRQHQYGCRVWCDGCPTHCKSP